MDKIDLVTTLSIQEVSDRMRIVLRELAVLFLTLAILASLVAGFIIGRLLLSC